MKIGDADLVILKVILLLLMKTEILPFFPIFHVKR